MANLKGVLFTYLMLFSSTFGAIYFLTPLIPLVLFQPRVGRRFMDQMIWLWQIYAVDNPGENSAVLLITFSSPDSSRISPQLYLSPRVEHALGGSSNLRIPAFPSGCMMMDYVPNVCQLLQNKVDQVAQMSTKKKEYISSFLSYFGRSLLEFDADGFSQISFLLEWNDFFFIFHIDLPPFFPQEQPIFTLQSIYHECKGKPYTEVHDEYPYSPRWSGIEMADRARNYVLDNIGTFQKQSVISGSL